MEVGIEYTMCSIIIRLLAVIAGKNYYINQHQTMKSFLTLSCFILLMQSYGQNQSPAKEKLKFGVSAGYPIEQPHMSREGTR